MIFCPVLKYVSLRKNSELSTWSNVAPIFVPGRGENVGEELAWGSEGLIPRSKQTMLQRDQAVAVVSSSPSKQFFTSPTFSFEFRGDL